MQIQAEKEIYGWDFMFPGKPLLIGQKVAVNECCEYSGDWPGEYVISGVNIDHYERINITITPTLDSVGCEHTDGWRVDQLHPV